jgi:hypothetical protein
MRRWLLRVDFGRRHGYVYLRLTNLCLDDRFVRVSFGSIYRNLNLRLAHFCFNDGLVWIGRCRLNYCFFVNLLRLNKGFVGISSDGLNNCLLVDLFRLDGCFRRFCFNGCYALLL